MDLLVCVINDDTKLDDILTGLVDLGITGATVLRSQGTGHRVRSELPALAGLQDLVNAGRPENTTLFSVIQSRDKLDAALDLVQRICGDLLAPDTGIVFTVPVDRVVGLAPELDPRSSDGGDSQQRNPGVT